MSAQQLQSHLNKSDMIQFMRDHNYVYTGEGNPVRIYGKEKNVILDGLPCLEYQGKDCIYLKPNLVKAEFCGAVSAIENRSFFRTEN